MTLIIRLFEIELIMRLVLAFILPLYVSKSSFEITPSAISPKILQPQQKL